MHDVLENGRKFSVLNLMDDLNREALAVEAAHSFPSERVVGLLERITDYRGKPEGIRVNNGSEIISHNFRNWFGDKEIDIPYTQPGKPTQNTYIE